MMKYCVTGLLHTPASSWARTVIECSPVLSADRSTVATDAPSTVRPVTSPSSQYSVLLMAVAACCAVPMMKYCVTGLLHSPPASCARTVMLCRPALSPLRSMPPPLLTACRLPRLPSIQHSCRTMAVCPITEDKQPHSASRNKQICLIIILSFIVFDEKLFYN